MEGLEFTGDWEKVKDLIYKLPELLASKREELLPIIGLYAESQAVQMIDAQPSTWEKLNERYLKRKMQKGLSEKIYVATGSYKQAITSFVIDDTAYAGVRKTAKNSDGEPIADIVMTLEYGSEKRKIPARPLWLPVRAKTIQKIQELLNEEIIKTGREIITGKRGGKYYLSPSGRKIYIK